MTRTNPNEAAAATSSADKTDPAACPLNSNYIQLLPVRYAFVENLACRPAKGDAEPVHPVGLRFIRDGWLYIVDTGSGRLYEHVLKDGLVAQRTFKGKALSGVIRDSYDDIEQEDNKELRLLFKKGHKLYISYSAAQWTDAKCNQMLKSKERKMFMQEVNLADVSCEHIPEHLFTRGDAETLIAEVAEEHNPPDYPVEFSEESEPYSWTSTSFKKASIGKLTGQLKKEYEQKGNYLFVAVHDYLGMMLDLAQEQRLVAKWLGDWSEKDDNSLKYQTAAYIESTLTITPQNAAQKGASPWIDGLPADHKQALYDYVNDKIAFDREKQFRYWKEADEQLNKEGVDTDRTPEYYQRLEEVNAKKRRAIELIGEEDYNAHEAEVEALERHQKAHLQGESFGGRGVNRLVKLPEMQKYLATQRPKYQRWQARLDKITAERCRLYTAYYHMHTWYFDLSQQADLLCLENEVMSDLLRNDEATIAISEFLEQNPPFTYPAIQTNFDLDYVTENLPLMVKWFADTDNYVESTVVGQAPTAIEKLEALIGPEYWKQLFIEVKNSKLDALRKIHALNLSPAINLSLGNFIKGLTEPMLKEEAQAKFNSALDRYKDLTDKLNLSARAHYLLEMRQTGFVYLSDKQGTQGRATQAINTINKYLTLISKNQTRLAEKLRQRERLRDPQSEESRKIATDKARQSEYKKLSNDIARLQKQNNNHYRTVEDTQNRLATLISPLAEGEGNASLRFNLSADYQTALDFEKAALSKGFLTAYGQNGKGFAAMAKGTSLPTFLMGFSIYNLTMAWEQFTRDKVYGTQQLGPVLGNLLGTISSISSVWQTAHITVLENVVSQINLIKPGIAGAELLGNIGRLNVILGGAGQVFGAFSNYTNLYNNFSKWYDGIMNGDSELAASAAAALAASVGNAAVGTYGLIQTGITTHHVIRDLKVGQVAARTVWAVRGAQYATAIGRVTPIGLILTAVQLVGEYAYNYFNTSEFQNWFLHGCWGQKAKGWDQLQHNHQLAEALLKPVLIDKGVVEYEGRPYRTIEALFPGQINGSLAERPVQWQAQWLHNELHHPNIDATVGELLLQSARITGDGSLTLELRLPWLVQDEWWPANQNVLHLRLFHTPDLTDSPLGGEQGLGYLIPLNSWTNDKGEAIRQVAGNKVTINADIPLITYKGEIYG